MGGATELALAAHGRVMADDKATRMALPEVKIGIFPGAGGTQRVMRMADAQAGLEFLLKGSAVDGKRAKSMKLVDEVTSREKLVETAKAMIARRLEAGEAVGREGLEAGGRGANLLARGFPALAGGERALSQGDLRQLSWSAISAAVGVRRPAASDRPGAEGREPLFRARRCRPRKRRR